MRNSAFAIPVRLSIIHSSIQPSPTVPFQPELILRPFDSLHWISTVSPRNEIERHNSNNHMELVVLTSLCRKFGLWSLDSRRLFRNCFSWDVRNRILLFFNRIHDRTNKGKWRFSRFQDLNCIAMKNQFRDEESLNDRPRSVSKAVLKFLKITGKTSCSCWFSLSLCWIVSIT